MNSTIYKSDLKVGLLNEQVFVVRDYFKYYTTGVESLIREYPDYFNFTIKRRNERPELIAQDLYKNADESDVIVAINNMNYLDPYPLNYDMEHKVKEFRINYLQYLMKKRYENIADIMDGRVQEDIYTMNNISKTIIVPSVKDIALVKRKIEDYFISRTVDYFDVLV